MRDMDSFFLYIKKKHIAVWDFACLSSAPFLLQSVYSGVSKHIHRKILLSFVRLNLNLIFLCDGIVVMFSFDVRFLKLKKSFMSNARHERQIYRSSAGINL